MKVFIRWLDREIEFGLFFLVERRIVFPGCLIPLEKKVVVKRQPVKRDALAPTSRPEAIINVEKEDDSVEETVQKIKLLISNHLKETGKPIEFFRLILDPDEFGKTIENLLHVAFLVRDGIIKIQENETGEPVIIPCSKEMKAAAKRDKIPNTQNVLSLNFDEWQVSIFSSNNSRGS